jgi:tetratricopeptide (TPR) repeat protein
VTEPAGRTPPPDADPDAATRRYARVKEILIQLGQAAPPERPALLARLCASDDGLRAEVDSLLAVEGLDVPHLRPEVLQAAAREALASRPAAECSAAERPERIGPYRILDVLGEGGMGTVFLAEQETPIRRDVALKLIRRDVDRTRIAARFDGERQALAMMNHPSIAHILDAGEDANGYPYFVMEYVRGEPITAFCDSRRLPVRTRLSLLLEVCEAVAHAHQRGVIHRDLKPSNILITETNGRATPKIIDFGIAKAVGDAPLHDSHETQVGTLVGTPEYMSPEQAGAFGSAVDTRTDVYALGVVLYELLSGARPHALAGKSFRDIQRTLTEREPERASEAVRRSGSAAAAASRSTTPARLASVLRGDVDAVLAMALRPDPDRRYASVDRLATDLRRPLASQPVAARRGAWRYRAGKFVMRHRVALGAAAVVVIAAAGVAVTLVTQSVRVANERDRAVAAEERARREAATAAQVSDFLVTLFDQANPDETGGEDVSARELLDHGAARVRDELRDQPVVQARLLATMARVYQGLGRYREATEMGTAALALQREHLTQDDPEMAASLDILGTITHDDGKLDASEAYYREALTIRRAALGDSADETAESYRNLGVTLQAKGDLSGAEPLYREALRLYRARHGDHHVETAWSKNSLAWCVHQQGRYAEAESLYRQAYATQRRLLGGRHPDVAGTLNNLAGVRFHRGDDEEAERLWRDALAMYRTLYPKGHPAVPRAEYNVARVLRRRGALREAEALRRSSLANMRKLVGPRHPYIASNLYGLGVVLVDEGKTAEAEPLLVESLALRRSLYGSDHTSTAFSLEAMGDLRLAQGRAAEALRLFHEADAIRSALQPAEHGDRALPLLGIARAKLRLGDRSGADSAAAAALANRRRAFEEPHPWIAEANALRRETELRPAPRASLGE